MNSAIKAGLNRNAVSVKPDPETSKVFDEPSPGMVTGRDAVGVPVIKRVVPGGSKTLRALAKLRFTSCGGLPGPDITVAVPVRLVLKTNSTALKGSDPLY